MPIGYQNLVYAIFERAFNDYNHLRKLGVTEHRIKDTKYSIKEIRKFLRSDWCRDLLNSIDADVTGAELIEALQVKHGEWVG